jgi:hypothetical protein
MRGDRRKPARMATRRLLVCLAFLLAATLPFSATPSLAKYVLVRTDRAVVRAADAFPIKTVDVIAGITQVGQTLTAGEVTPAGATVTYQWQRSSEHDGTYTDIPGATSSTYVLTGPEFDKYIRVVVTGFGSYSGSLASEPVGPVIAAPLLAIGPISGDAQVGQTVTAGDLTPTGATADYLWQRSDSAGGVYDDIDGATAASYEITVSDVGKYLKVTATGTAGYTGTVSSEHIGPVPRVPLVSIGNIAGTAKVGRTLTAGPLTPSGVTADYQWLSAPYPDGPYIEIPGATGSTYTLTELDFNRYIVVQASGTGSFSGVVISAHAGPVGYDLIPITAIGAISGDAQVGHVLTAGGLTPGGASATYQWQVSANLEGPWVDITGATHESYVPVPGNLGHYVRVRASGSGRYTGEVASDAVGPIDAGQLMSIGPTAGTVANQYTITAGEVSPAGATVTYQWQKAASIDGPFSDIPGATSRDYTIVHSDHSQWLRVAATGTGSYDGTVYSVPVGPVVWTPIPLTSMAPVTGTPSVGSTLTVGTVMPANSTVTYRWLISNAANGPYEPIDGATSPSYTVGLSDIGKYLKVEATGRGEYVGTLTSNAVGPVTPGVISAIGDIIGAAEVGRELTAGPLTPVGATATYQWKICNMAGGVYQDIPGATSETYVLTIDDLGKYLKVEVHGTGVYSGSALSNYVGPVVLIATPITGIGPITGTAAVASNLYAGQVTPPDATVTYRWMSASTPGGVYTTIPGAASPTYSPTPADLGKYIKVEVTGSGAYSGTASSEPVGPVSIGHLVSIGPTTGTVANQHTIVAGEVIPAGATVTYQWQRSTSAEGPFEDINNAITNDYDIIWLDYNYWLRVAVKGTGAFSGTIYSEPVGPVQWTPIPITSMAPVSGSPSVGSTLTSGTLTPANSTATYRWLISDTLDGIYTPIAGATSPSYTIVPDDIGKYLKVEATGTGAYSGVRTSSAVGPVTKGPLTAIGGIVGATQVGAQVTAGPVTPVGATVTYRWMKAASPGGAYSPIEGAVFETYIVSEDDLGMYLKVEATGTGVYTGTVTSSHAGPVVMDSTPITAIGSIVGTPQVARTLVAGAVTPAGATVTYQWKRADIADGVYENIPAATSISYKPVPDDVGKYLKVTAIGSGAYSGTVTSGAVGPVTRGQLVSVGDITGTVANQHTIVAGEVIPAGATVTYQWQTAPTKDGPFVDVIDAITNDYDITWRDRNQWLRVAVTGTGGYTGTVYSAPVGPVAWNPTPLASMGPVAGTPSVGSILTAGTLSPADSTATYQWLRGDSAGGSFEPISGATHESYTTRAEDLDKYLKVQATGIGQFSGTLTSGAVGPVTVGQIISIGDIVGATEVGNELVAGEVIPVGATVTYQWKASDSPGGTFVDIPGATLSTYLVSVSDLGKYLRVEATGIGAYTGVVISNPTGHAVTDSTPIEGIGPISGTPEVAQTLTAGAVSPPDATVTYQWTSAETEDGIYEVIPGAIYPTYTVTADQVGRYMRVTVTGSGRYSGTATSEVVGPVQPGQLVSVGDITGTVANGYTIVAGPVSPAGATVTYQWQKADSIDGPYVDIFGANTNDYDIIWSDFDQWLRVEVTGTGAYTGTVHSAPVGPVTWHPTDDLDAGSMPAELPESDARASAPPEPDLDETDPSTPDPSESDPPEPDLPESDPPEPDSLEPDPSEPDPPEPEPGTDS